MSEMTPYDIASWINEDRADVRAYDAVPHDKGVPFAAASAWRAECTRKDKRIAELEAQCRDLKQSEMHWVGEAERYSADEVRLEARVNESR